MRRTAGLSTRARLASPGDHLRPAGNPLIRQGLEHRDETGLSNHSRHFILLHWSSFSFFFIREDCRPNVRLALCLPPSRPPRFAFIRGYGESEAGFEDESRNRLCLEVLIPLAVHPWRSVRLPIVPGGVKTRCDQAIGRQVWESSIRYVVDAPRSGIRSPIRRSAGVILRS